MQRTPALLIKYVGATMSEVPSPFHSAMESAAKAIEQKYPKVTDAKIQGTTPHKSIKDKGDPKEVVTISYHTEAGTRVASIHAHNDGTWKEFPSRNAYKGQ